MSGLTIVAIYASDDRTKLRVVLDDEDTVIEFDALRQDHGDQVGEIDLSDGWVGIASFGDDGEGGESW